MACKDYLFTRRNMLKTFSASMLGMPVSQLLAKSNANKAQAEHVILFWNSGGGACGTTQRCDSATLILVV